MNIDWDSGGVGSPHGNLCEIYPNIVTLHIYVLNVLNIQFRLYFYLKQQL